MIIVILLIIFIYCSTALVLWIFDYKSKYFICAVNNLHVLAYIHGFFYASLQLFGQFYMKHNLTRYDILVSHREITIWCCKLYYFSKIFSQF